MKISEALNVSSSKLWNAGAFDAYLGIDSRLHIDPALLKTTRIPAFRNSIKRFYDYFDKVLLLIASATPGGAIERQAINRLIFPEIPAAALGFSVDSDRGRGVSRTLATRLYNTAREIVHAGIQEPAIFELAVIFEDKFGPDLISDMTLQVILEDVSRFNADVCDKLGIAAGTITVGGRTVTTAYSAKLEREILLIPRGLLSELPEASCFEDIATVVQYNDSVRAALNKLLGKNWEKLVRLFKKRDLRALLLKNPDLFREILTEYKTTQPRPYDFDVDPLGEVVWKPLGSEFAEDYHLALHQIKSPSDLAQTVRKIGKQFKRLIEVNGLCDHLYVDGKRRPEKFAQLLFYAVADSYCRANDLDLSAEPNAGRGPVDFKMSHGYGKRATVELKLSSNSGALDGFLIQLPEYSLAEQSVFDCFIIIIVGKSRKKVDEIVSVRNDLLKKHKPVPDLIIINAFDAYNAPSASKLRVPPTWRN